MAISLKNALKAYDRVDVAEIDCGNGWTCEIHSFNSVAKQFSKEQARIRARGGMNKRKVQTASAVYVQPDGTVKVTDENSYLLGSYEADVDFFVEYVLEGWSGLKDDTGKNVAYSQDTARKLFLENGEPAKRLLQELYWASLDNENFVNNATDDDVPVTQMAQAETDGKN